MLAIAVAIVAFLLETLNADTGNRSTQPRRYVAVASSAATLGASTGPALMQVRVLSHNIMANITGWNVRKVYDEQAELRVKLIIAGIGQLRPDVIAFQEVDVLTYQFLLENPLWERGYDGKFSASRTLRIGVALFWKRDKFNLEGTHEASLHKPAKAQGFRSDRYFSVTPRTALFAALTPRRARLGQHMLIVGTVHITSGFPSNLDLQVFQALQTLQALDAFCMQKEVENQPYSIDVILMGDMNTLPYVHAAAVDRLMIKIRLAALFVREVDQEFWDEYDNCRCWAKEGQCKETPARMLIACAHSCALVGITAEHRRQLLCQEWKSLGYCHGERSERMWLRCAGACEVRQRPLTRRKQDAVLQCPLLEAAYPSPVYELFTKGHLSEKSVGLLVLAVQAAGLKPTQILLPKLLTTELRFQAMQSAHLLALGHEPPTCQCEPLDYIFFSSRGTGAAWEIPQLQLLRVLAPPAPQPIEKTVGSTGSDHVPVVAHFAFVLGDNASASA